MLIHVRKKAPGNVSCEMISVLTCRIHGKKNLANFYKQDRRWNADKPSAALDPCIPTWWTTSPANYRPANFWKPFFLNIGSKLWKVVQSQVELMKINFKFEVSLYLTLISLSIYIHIYIYISSYCIIFSRSVLRYIVIHRVGDNGRTVNTWIRRRVRTFLISWGQKTRV